MSFEQIGRVFAVTLAAALVAGSIGSILALWREKTFQTLALTVLVLVFWLAAGEALARGALGAEWFGISTEVWAAALSPWQSMLLATRPLVAAQKTLPYVGDAINAFLLFAGGRDRVDQLRGRGDGSRVESFARSAARARPRPKSRKASGA